jgi:hypothetical protein
LDRNTTGNVVPVRRFFNFQFNRQLVEKISLIIDITPVFRKWLCTKACKSLESVYVSIYAPLLNTCILAEALLDEMNINK